MIDEWKFICNRYGSCVVDKIVNGKQLSVAWHVNNLNVSHVEEKVVENFDKDMDHQLEKETPLSVSRGLMHEYLIMMLDFSEIRISINLNVDLHQEHAT